MSPTCLKLFTFLLLAPGVAAYSLRRGQSTGMSPYDPVDILCERGRNEEGKILAPWCKQWLGCIKDKATPAESPDAVLKAWAPADCREICDIWLTSSASLMQNPTQHNTFGDIQRSTHDATGCKKSCTAFQKSLSTCVATIMFEPGKVAAMGAPKGQKAAHPNTMCGMKESPCVPDLPIRHQKCAAHRTRKVLDPSYEVSDEDSQACKLVALNMEDCADCPQLGAGAQSQYAAFTGGCMDQLNSYWVASNYGFAGMHAALPSETGCRVHSKVQLKAGVVRKAAEVAQAQKDLAARLTKL